MAADANPADHWMSPQSHARQMIRAIAAALAATAIVAFQSGFLAFFQPLFADDPPLWRTIYYGYWGLTLAVALIVFCTDPVVRRQSVPVVVICPLIAALAFLHPLDWVSKNLIVAMLLLPCVIILTAGSATLHLMRLSASVTALNAAICLLDILFPDGFTNTVGRAAGLALNPNDAATGLLLGTAATWWAVPRRWQGSFLVLGGAGIFVTLSRSTLLAGVLIAIVVATMSLGRSLRDGKRPRLRWSAMVYGGLLVLFLASWIASALFTNDRFAIAAGDSFSGLRGALSAIEVASRPARLAVQDLAARRAPAGAGMAETESHARAFEAARVEAQVAAISKVSETEGDKNSVSARALFMWRSFIMYEAGPFFGRGLAVAHDLVPHNTFLLFAVAFGHLGWLVPLALAGLTLWRVRSENQLPLAMAVITVMMTSHDILFPGLIVPIAIGIAGNISGPAETQVTRASLGGVRGVTIAASVLFIIGCSVIVLKFAGDKTISLATGVKPVEDSDFVFAARLARPEFSGVLRLADVSSEGSPGEKLLLMEDGKVLSDSQARDTAVMTEGMGRYLIWRRNTLLFSTSDNSDPRVNGRAYEVRVPVSIHPLVLAVAAGVLAWCMMVMYLSLVPGRVPRLPRGQTKRLI
jgi:hypothetical protein